MEILPQIEKPSKGFESPEGLPGRLVEELMQKSLELGRFVESAAREGTAAHDVELGIWGQVLAIGRETMSLFFQLVGDGDMGEEVTLPDGRSVGAVAGAPFATLSVGLWWLRAASCGVWNPLMTRLGPISRCRCAGPAKQRAYSDDSDHPFQGKATSSLSESMQGSSSGQ